MNQYNKKIYYVLFAVIFAFSVLSCGGGSSGSSSAVQKQFVYVSNTSDNTISQFAVGDDGALSSLPQATIASSNYPISITADGDKGMLFSSNINSPGGIAQFTIGTDGQLKENEVYGSDSFTLISIHPLYSFLYGCVSSNIVYEFGIDNNGRLDDSISSGSSSMPASVYADYIIFSPDGSNAYVTATGTSAIYQFTYRSDGHLVECSPAYISTSAEISRMVVTPDGNYLYAAGSSAGYVYIFKVAADGALSAASMSSVYAGTNPSALAVTPDGEYLYAAGTNGIYQFVIGSDGSLTPNTTQIWASAKVIKSGNMVIDSSGKYLYATTFDASFAYILQYGIDNNGLLYKLSAGETVSAGKGNYGIAVVSIGN